MNAAGSLELAAEIIQRGEIVALPTETVYGLAGDALNKAAIERIFAAKGRPADNPLIVHIADFADMYRFWAYVPALAAKLAERFWPGPLTMILPRKPGVPDYPCGGLATIALRMPKNAFVLELIRLSGGPLAMPSANVSGYPSPTTADHVNRDLNGKIPLIIDGGRCPVGFESTVVTLGERNTKIRVLRPGNVSVEELAAFAPCVVDSSVTKPLSKGEKALSPGVLYKHYSPKARVILVNGSETAVRNYTESNFPEAALILNPGGDIYDVLRGADDDGAATVIARTPVLGRNGLAIYNRLLRAAGFDEIFLECDKYQKKRVFGLTGMSGSGKSAASRIFAEEGFIVIDCDVIAKLVVSPNTKCSRELQQKFPDFFVCGMLDRRKTAAAIYSDAALKRDYEAVIYPYISFLVIEKILSVPALTPIILDAPTLFESGVNDLCGGVISIVTTKVMAISRIMSRDNLQKEAAVLRLDAQHSREFFAEHADFFVQNDTDNLSAFTEEIRLLAQKIKRGLED